MSLLVADTEFANDPIADPQAHAAMLEDYARHPERIIRYAAIAFVVWAAFVAVFS